MLRSNHLSGFSARVAGASVAAAPVLTYQTNASDTVDRTTYTFNTQAIGTASADRYVIVACCWRGTVDRTLSSATIGGAAATIDVQALNSTSHVGVALVRLLVAAGTTATITFTLSGAATEGGIHVYSLTGDTVATPTATGSDTTSDGTPAFSVTLNIGNNGCFIVCGTMSTTNGSSQWSPAEIVGDDVINNAGLFAPSASAASMVGGSTALTWFDPGADYTGVLIAATWSN